MADEPRVQCEACDETIPESEATFEEYPGATLAFCQDCTEKPLGQQYGFGRVA